MPMHYENWVEAREHQVEWVDGCTYRSALGPLWRFDSTDGLWHPALSTDTPALLRPDDPPWYREPTADKPGIVRPSDYPGVGWEWSYIGDDEWARGVSPVRPVEARRIEPAPEPVTVAVEVGLLERLVRDAARGHSETTMQERRDLIAEASR